MERNELSLALAVLGTIVSTSCSCLYLRVWLDLRTIGSTVLLLLPISTLLASVYYIATWFLGPERLISWDPLDIAIGLVACSIQLLVLARRPGLFRRKQKNTSIKR